MGQKFTICFDTLCQGLQPVMETDENNQSSPIEFATLAEAQAEIDSDSEMYGDCVAVPISQIGHKTIFTGTENS